MLPFSSGETKDLIHEGIATDSPSFLLFAPLSYLAPGALVRVIFARLPRRLTVGLRVALQGVQGVKLGVVPGRVDKYGIGYHVNTMTMTMAARMIAPSAAMRPLPHSATGFSSMSSTSCPRIFRNMCLPA